MEEDTIISHFLIIDSLAKVLQLGSKAYFDYPIRPNPFRASPITKEYAHSQYSDMVATVFVRCSRCNI
jgi:hypothetical protein